MRAWLLALLLLSAPALAEETRVTPFLMFQRERAQAAMDFYLSVFPDSRILSIERYGPGEDGKEGSVKHATFRVAGQNIMCIDSVIPHQHTFTPSFSMFVEVPSEAEVDRIGKLLGEGGQVLVPLGEYPFARRFIWVNDRFGVSWQVAHQLRWGH